MTSSELWTRATADRYDTEENERSSAAFLGPTLAFLADLASYAGGSSYRSARD